MSGFDVDTYGMKYTTDPRERRLFGVAYSGDDQIPYKMPAISHIYDDIWIGGVEPGLVVPDFFEHLVTLETNQGAYRLDHKLKSWLIVSDFHDSVDQPLDDINNLIDFVDSRVGPTLVHCHMGLNRSAFVVAGVLIERTRWSPDDIIQHIRDHRSPAALCNSHFVRTIRSRFN